MRCRQHRSATIFPKPTSLEKCAETSNRYLISNRPPLLMRFRPPPFSLYVKSAAFITPRKRTKTPSPLPWSKLREPPCAFFQHSKPAHRPGIEKQKRQRQKLAPFKDLASRALRSS